MWHLCVGTTIGRLCSRHFPRIRNTLGQFRARQKRDWLANHQFSATSERPCRNLTNERRQVSYKMSSEPAKGTWDAVTCDAPSPFGPSSYGGPESPNRGGYTEPAYLPTSPSYSPTPCDSGNYGTTLGLGKAAWADVTPRPKLVRSDAQIWPPSSDMPTVEEPPTPTHARQSAREQETACEADVSASPSLAPDPKPLKKQVSCQCPFEVSFDRPFCLLHFDCV